MKTIYLVFALMFVSLPAMAADYVYSKAERERLEAVAVEFDKKAEELYEKAYAASHQPHTSARTDVAFYTGEAAGYLEAAKRIREEAAKVKQKMRGYPWRQPRENVYTNPVVPPNLDPNNTR